MTIAGFNRIGIVGAGQMGLGIAQVFAQNGLKVNLVDSNSQQLEKAKKTIEFSLEKFVSKEKISKDQAQNAISSIQYQTNIEVLESADLVVEAVTEVEDVKNSIFLKLDKICNPKTILASNTSSISITRLGANTKRPDKFIGMHFMNPVPLMKLVEVIEGFATSNDTSNRIIELSEAIGKEVTKSKDYPGFVVNRILMPMINEAFTALLEGVASPEDIDKAMKLGTNQPMGPLALADFIGLDTCLAILNVLFHEIKDPRYRPSTLLVKYVEAGYYGRKVKKGVYEY